MTSGAVVRGSITYQRSSFGIGACLLALRLAAMTSAIFWLISVAALVVVIVGIVQVVRTPGLDQGAKWLWGLGMGIGFWLFWLPGVVAAIVFLSIRSRWARPRGELY
jgi:hypothetical protein